MTPLAADAYIDHSEIAGASILTSMDHKVGMQLPGLPRTIIDYSNEDNENHRRYCIYGQEGKDIYHSCYRALLR